MQPKKPANWIQYWPVALICLVCLLPFYRLFLGESLGPWDHIAKMVHPNAKTPSSAWDVLQADSILQFYVWRDLVFTAWGRLETPYWNPYELSGTPLLANSQSGALYPLHMLMGLLHVPTVAAMNLLAYAHVAWAAIGTWWLTRRLSGSVSLGTNVGGVLAGIALATCTFMTSWVTLPSVVTTVAWLPWLLGSAVKTVPTDEGEQPKSLAFGWPMLFGAMMLLSGHLQFAFYGFLAYGLFVLFTALVEKGPILPRSGRLLLFILAGTVGAALIASDQLIPVLKNGATSHRQNVASEEGYQAYVAGAIAPFELTGLASPSLLGDPKVNTESKPGEPQFSSYWPQFVTRGGNLAEGAVFLSPLLLAGVVLLDPKRWRQWAPLLLIAVLAALLALGTPLNRLLYFGIPGWSATGSPGRIIIVYLLPMSVLGGLGIARLINGEIKFSTQPEKIRLGAAVLMPVILLAVSFNLLQDAKNNLKPFFPGLPQEWLSNQISSVSGTGMALAGITAIASLAILVLAFRTPKQSAQFVLIGGCVLLGLSSAGAVRTAPFEDLRLTTLPIEPNERVAVINKSWGMFGTPTTILPPNLLSLSRIHEVSGYDSILDREYVQKLRVANGQDPAPPENGNMMLIKPTANLENLAALGVTTVLSKEPLPGATGTLDSNSGLYVTKIKGVGRVQAVGGTAKIEYDSFDKQVISVTPGTTRVTILDRYTDAWTSTNANAEPSTNDGWRTIKVQPNVQKIELRYSRVSIGWQWSMLRSLALACALISFTLSLWLRKKVLTSPEPETPDDKNV